MNSTNKKRLAKDIVDIIKCPLTDNGIYYKHDEDDMLVGYALIMGPEDTIYNYGYYFFKFNFTEEYPFKPPVLEYLTNGNGIRFHPNLYRNGKVCLSLLNTWSGEQWTSCQTIRTILLNLVTLFHNKPLLNEPGITEKYKYFNKYNEIIEFSNFIESLLRLNKQFNLKGYSMAYDVFSKFKGSSSKIIKNIKVPMFYITGEKDFNSTPLMSKNLAKLTKSNYVIIKNARHILQLTHSTKFNFHLNQFIKSLK